MKLLVLILIQLFCFSISNDGDRLVFLYTHFRHGARAPNSINSKYLDSVGEKWTNPGELTGIGQRMHYLLGLRNRIRYIENEKFLSEKFDPHEILIYSTNVNRTLVSVSSQLQGLYPQSAQLGEVLTEAQEKVAVPEVDINFTKINDEIKKLNRSSLPYYMMLAPVRMINIEDYSQEGCTKKLRNVQKINRNSTYITNFTNDFNNKFGKILNDYLNETNKTYTLSSIESFCDAFLCSYTDQRNMTDFKKTGVDMKEMNDYCNENMRVIYLYQNNGDDEKIMAHIDSRKSFPELMYHMKRRLDADITEEDEDENYKDYSRPKMLMISGHDTTTSAQEVFLLYVLGLNITELYTFPKFSAQLAIEVRTKKENGKASKYADYYVLGYFNDKQLFNVTADEFIKKVEGEIWSQEKINEVCGINETDSKAKNSTDNKNGTASDTVSDTASEDSSTNNNTFTYTKKKDNAKKAYKALMIVFIVLTAILLATTLCLAFRTCRRNNIVPIDPSFNGTIANKTLK